jgi:hypothetical protein
MIDFDICLCGNKEECPYKDTCLRAINPPPGIYTYSLFYNKDKECDEYITLGKDRRYE